MRGGGTPPFFHLKHTLRAQERPVPHEGRGLALHTPRSSLHLLLVATQAPDGGVNAHTPAGVRGSLKAGRHAGTKHVAETMLGAGSLPAWRAFPAAFPPVLRGATMHVALCRGDRRPSGIWKGLPRFLRELLPGISLPRLRILPCTLGSHRHRELGAAASGRGSSLPGGPRRRS